MQAINLLASFGVTTVLFAAMYKYVPDVRIEWRDVWIGAVVTSALFTLGKFAIGLYLGRSSVASAYGAAGSLVIILVWVYYSAQILLFGAEFTKVYAKRYGSGIRPDVGAVPVTAGGTGRARPWAVSRPPGVRIRRAPSRWPPLPAAGDSGPGRRSPCRRGPVTST